MCTRLDTRFDFCDPLPPGAAGEAAVASAAERSDLLQGSDADKVLALGARILSSMTPFVAAAAQRVKQEDLFDLTSRLHQVMLSAAGLAARQRSQDSRTAGGSSAGTAGSTLTMQQSRSAQDTGVDPDASWQQEDLVQVPAKQRGSSREPAQRDSSRKDVTAKALARMQRLAARKETSQKRLQRRQERQQAKGKQPKSPAAASVAAPSSRVLITDLGGQTYAWGSAGAAAGSSRRNNSMDGGMRLGAGMSCQQLLGDVQAAKVAEEDVVHPWTWDVTQPLTVLSGGVKVGAAAARASKVIVILTSWVYGCWVYHCFQVARCQDSLFQEDPGWFKNTGSMLTCGH